MSEEMCVQLYPVFYDHDRFGAVHEVRLYNVFFFQAEDGIRDGTVTGVQTCALPILCIGHRGGGHRPQTVRAVPGSRRGGCGCQDRTVSLALRSDEQRPREYRDARGVRSEERRVGKEWRGGGRACESQERRHVTVYSS